MTPEEERREQLPLPKHPPSKHVAADRFASQAIRSAAAIEEGLAAAGVPDVGPVPVDRNGPRHSLAGLDRLLSSALEVEEAEESNRAAADEEVSPDPPPAGR